MHVVTPAAFQTWLQSQPANASAADRHAAAERGPARRAGRRSRSARRARRPSTSPSGSTAAPLSASAAAGKAVFTGAAGCSSCHTLAAAGATGTVGPDLGTKVVPDAKTRGLPLKQFILESIIKPNAFISSGFQPNIDAAELRHRSLSPTQIQQLVDFIASVTK